MLACRTVGTHTWCRSACHRFLGRTVGIITLPLQLGERMMIIDRDGSWLDDPSVGGGRRVEALVFAAAEMKRGCIIIDTVRSVA
jgi:hypothetical protein